MNSELTEFLKLKLQREKPNLSSRYVYIAKYRRMNKQTAQY